MRSSTEKIIIERAGSAVVIRLNRPRALNSLDLDMVRAIAEILDAVERAPDIACVVLAGEGDRGLCAGGDVRIIHDLGKAGDPAVTRFWREEFPLNHRIANFPKPYVALMDGITMGGGVGLSAHGRHRVVTERTRLAMPETGIGYFPDVGATWLLPRAPGETGTWLGLTGNDIGPADAIFAGLADHLIATDDLSALVMALGRLPPAGGDRAVRETLKGFSRPPEGGMLEANRELIDSAFAHDDVGSILAALEHDGSPFAEDTRTTMLRRSPTSLKLTLRLLRLGRRSADLMACLEREFTVATRILRGHDFYEGVRAALIDKDRNPKWLPPTLDAVGDADIEHYLEAGDAPLLFNHRM